MSGDAVFGLDLDELSWVAEFQIYLDRVDQRHANANDPESKRRRGIDQLKVLAVCLGRHAVLGNSVFYEDIQNLVFELESLDRGRHPEILKPSVGQSLKGRSTPKDDDFKSFVLTAHQLAIESGCSKTEADSEIAKMLTRAGFCGTQHSNRAASGARGFPKSTLVTWRTNLPSLGSLEAELLDKRISRFKLSLQAQADQKKSKTQLLAWVEMVIIKSTFLRALRS